MTHRPHAELAARLRNIECSLLDEDENATLREAADLLNPAPQRQLMNNNTLETIQARQDELVAMIAALNAAKKTINLPAAERYTLDEIATATRYADLSAYQYNRIRDELLRNRAIAAAAGATHE